MTKTHAEFLEELRDYIENVALPNCEKEFSYYEGELHLKNVLEKIEQFQVEQKQVGDG